MNKNDARYSLREPLQLEVLEDVVLVLDHQAPAAYRFDGTEADVLRRLADGDDLADLDAEGIEARARLIQGGFVVDAASELEARRRVLKGAAAAAAAGAVLLVLPKAVAAASSGGSGPGATTTTTAAVTTTSTSTTTTTTPSPVAPDAPTIATATTDGLGAQLTFTSGADGGSPLTNHEYSLDGGSTWTPLSPAQTSGIVTISSVAVGNVIKLRARNAAGASVASNTATVGGGSTSYTGSTLGSFVVPASVTRLKVDMVGGAGGRGGNNATYGGAGGQPGQVRGVLVVTPGETLTAARGGGGENGIASGTPVTAAGGQNALNLYEGGSAVGGANASTTTGVGSGGAGGAASILRRGSTDLVVAPGGGGGAGMWSTTAGPAGAGTLERTGSPAQQNGENATGTSGRVGGNGGGGGGRRGSSGARGPLNQPGEPGHRGLSTKDGLTTVQFDGAASGRTNGQDGYVDLSWLLITVA